MLNIIPYLLHGVKKGWYVMAFTGYPMNISYRSWGMMPGNGSSLLISEMGAAWRPFIRDEVSIPRWGLLPQVGS
jgi:hypothetical protein